VAEALPAMARAAAVTAVVEDPSTVDPHLRARQAVAGAHDAPDADLDLYHLGNSPAHGYVYRAALRRPGVALLHEWSLHHVVLSETVERGDPAAYLRAMRRAYGETGTFVGRQVARDLGGDVLPALFPLNEAVLERSLAVVALTEHVRARAARAVFPRPVLRLRHHVSLPPDALVSRGQARRALGLPAEALVVTAPGLATAGKRLDRLARVLGRLRARFEPLVLVLAGGADPRLPLARWAADAGLEGAWRLTGRVDLAGFVGHLCAADVVSCLRFPTHGEMSGALVRALGVGRPALVTAGTPAAQEFPAGVVAPVDPGRYEEAELEGVLGLLLGDPALRARMENVARAHVARAHGLDATVAELLGFLDAVRRDRATLAARVAEPPEEEGLLAYLLGEARGAARGLGLAALPLGVPQRVRECLAGEAP
jgi:glycosyltransferase involved in cell wall biosynthesis